MTKRRLGYPQLGSATPAGFTATKKDHARQTVYREVLVDSDILSALVDQNQTPEHNEALATVQADLASYLIKQAPSVLTERQWGVLSMWLTGRYTQQEIADHYGIAQTTVCKTLHGNDAYMPDGRSVRHGGVIKKLQLWAETDPEILSFLAQIAALQEEE